MKSWLIGKDSDAGRDLGQEEKGTTEDEMAGWHHRLDGREFEWIPGVGDGQGGLVYCNSWDRKESDMTERLNWTELKEMMPMNPYEDQDLEKKSCSLFVQKRLKNSLFSLLLSLQLHLINANYAPGAKLRALHAP